MILFIFLYLWTNLSHVGLQKLLQLPLARGGAVDAEVAVDEHNGVGQGSEELELGL